jgi:hypothetical protein
MNDFPVVDYSYVKENGGMWLCGDYDFDDYVLYLVNDQIVKVNVDISYLRELLFEKNQVIWSLVGLGQKEGR